jgi:hypothetical protein
MRRHLRDVEGGLLFSWRIPGGSFRRTALGVLVATGLFAGAGSLLHVEIPMPSGGNRESAQLLVLDPSDPEARDLLDWARLHSPFPTRWEPGPGGALETMMQSVTDELQAHARYQPLLQPRITKDPSGVLPGLIDEGIAPAPRPVVRFPNRVVGRIETGLELRSAADGPLAERWGIRTTDWETSEEGRDMGREASFMVGVDRDGQVVLCLVIDADGLDEEVISRLNQWVRLQALDSVPEQGERVWDVVRIRLQARVGNPEGGA